MKRGVSTSPADPECDGPDPVGAPTPRSRMDKDHGKSGPAIEAPIRSGRGIWQQAECDVDSSSTKRLGLGRKTEPFVQGVVSHSF